MAHTHESSWLGRTWAAMTEASSAAVAIHYAAPWKQSARARRRSASARGNA